MRIYSKKAFALGEGANRYDDKVNSVITVPMTFQDIPDKLANDPTFKLAVKAGEITVIRNEAQASVPSNAGNEENAENEAKEEVLSVEEFYEQLKPMSKEATKNLAEKYGAKFIDEDSLKVNKKRVLEAYRLYVNAEEETSEETEEEESEE